MPSKGRVFFTQKYRDVITAGFYGLTVTEALTSCGLSDSSEQLWRIPVYFRPAAQGGTAQSQRAAAAAGCAAALPISMPSCEA